MKRLSNIISILFFLLLTGVGNAYTQEQVGEMKMKKVNVPAFSKLFVSNSIEVVLEYGDFPGYILIEDNGGTIDPIIAQWTDGTLNLFVQRFGTKVIVKTTGLDDISISGSTLRCKYWSAFNRMSISVIGSAAIDFDTILATNLSIDVVANGNAKISRLIANYFEAQALNHGNITVRGIQANNVTADSRKGSLITLSGVCRRKSISIVNEGRVAANGLMEDSQLPTVIPDSIGSHKALSGWGEGKRIEDRQLGRRLRNEHVEPKEP